MELDLRGKKVLVTGASKGIGAAIAESFAQEGCNLVLVSRTESALRDRAAELHRRHFVAVDVLCTDLSAQNSAATIAAAHPDVDILVNNAGESPMGVLTDIDEQRWRAAWDLKLFGYINMCREFYRLMAGRGGGVIVNVTGVGAFTRDPGYICGVTCNAAINTFTESLGSESHLHNIRVVAICPGPVATERLAKMGKVDHSAYAYGRVATVREVADTVAFIASPRSTYTSGMVVTIDGGWSARARRS